MDPRPPHRDDRGRIDSDAMMRFAPLEWVALGAIALLATWMLVLSLPAR